MAHQIINDGHLQADVRESLLFGLLDSERRRAALAAALFFILVLLLLAAVQVPGVWPPSLVRPLRDLFLPFLSLFGGMFVYELLLRRRLGQLLDRRRYPSTLSRYLNLLLEVSLPTLLLLLLAQSMGMLQALSSPAPFLYPLFTFMAVLSLNPWLCLFGGAAGALEFGVLTQLFLLPETKAAGLELLSDPSSYHVKCALLLSAGLVAAFLTHELRHQLEGSIRGARERDRAISIFGQHVSPEVAAKLLEQPLEIGGEEREACVMFLDIREFSSFAAKRSPVEVMGYLNTLFSPMVDVINRHHGIVNKFLGDGFMAVFGVPVEDMRRCDHALEAAREILLCIDDLNASHVIAPTRVGVGLHVGRLVTGNVGTDLRKEYTLVGDTVNLAARIEEATKTHNARMLVSETVWSCLSDKPREAVDLGPCKLRGQKSALRLYQIA